MDIHLQQFILYNFYHIDLSVLFVLSTYIYTVNVYAVQC